MAVLEIALSEHEVADTQRKARELRQRVAEKPHRAKVTIDVGVLKMVLAFVDEAKLKVEVLRRPSRNVSGAAKSVAACSTADDEVTPQQAAKILKMSRPSVMRLIEEGYLHPRKVLSRNKLSRAEVVSFYKKNAQEQHQALQNLSTLSEEYDF